MLYFYQCIFLSVRIYIAIIRGPYCRSGPSHRWRLEETSGLHRPPAKMWWTLNYLADRSYSPPAPNRGFCQALTSTSSQCTHQLTEQISAYGYQSHSMLLLSGFISFLVLLCRFVQTHALKYNTHFSLLQ